MRTARRTLPLLALPLVARAQARWPDKAVRIIVPFTPGGPYEPLNRLFTEWMTRRFGQPFLIENRPGATGTIGAQAVMRAAPDGYTLLNSANTGMVVAPLVLKAAGYDPVRDFTPVGILQRYGLYIVISSALPIRNVAEFVAYAKARPGQLFYSSPGTGSVGHLAAASFCKLAGIEMNHISFGGVTQGVTAVMRGDAFTQFDSVGNSQQLVEEGKLRGLAVTSETRNPRVPDVPTLKELNFPWFPSEVWMGLYAPPGLPEHILQPLNAAVEEFLADPAVRGRLEGVGFTPGSGGPQALTKQILAERPGWVDAMELAGVKPE
jgi:tripartite-type tricarboxylate transporter receptor subunit TctC